MSLVRFEASYLHHIFAQRLRNGDWSGRCRCGQYKGPRRLTEDEALHDSKLHLRNDVGNDRTTIYLISLCRGIAGGVFAGRTPLLLQDAEWIGIFRHPQPEAQFEECESCGRPVERQEILDLSRMRFGKILCEAHFSMAKRAAAATQKP